MTTFSRRERTVRVVEYVIPGDDEIIIEFRRDV